MTNSNITLLSALSIVCLAVVLCFASKCTSEMAREAQVTERAKFGVREKIDQLEQKKGNP